MLSVSGLNLVPWPPARITACVGGSDFNGLLFNLGSYFYESGLQTVLSFM